MKTPSLNRRDFLKLTLSAAGAAALMSKPALRRVLARPAAPSEPVGDWEVLNPAYSPSARGEQSVTTLPDGVVAVFGGEGDNQNMFNDLYFYDSTNWKAADTTNKPPARRSHAAWISGDKMYVHGGQGQNQQPLDDLWTYDPATKQWTEVVISGPKPSARAGHRATALSDGSAVLSGGVDGDGIQGCIWKFNPPTNAFSLLTVSPIPMAYHVQQVVENTLFLLNMEKVVTLDLNTITGSITTGGPPLVGHAASALARSPAGNPIIFIFGGEKYDGKASDVVYEYKTNTNVLTQREQLMPFPLLGGACASCSNMRTRRTLSETLQGIELLFFGGSNGTAKINTTFKFSVRPPSVYLPLVMRGSH